MDAVIALVILVVVAIALAKTLRSPAYSDWRNLAKYYRTHYKPPANLAAWQSGKVGKLLYNGTLNLAATSKGLYLSTLPLLRFQTPPLLIPWEEVTRVQRREDRYYQNYELTIGDPAVATLVLPCKPLAGAIPFWEATLRAQASPAPPAMSLPKPMDSFAPAPAQHAPLQRLSRALLAEVAEQARLSSRLRQNYNFHAHEERVQRFLNAMQPGTYVRPHRHCPVAGANRFEFFLALQGALGLLVMDERGQVTHTERISAQGEVRGIELAQATFHTLVVLAADTVIFELKEGPYHAETDKEFLPMFPLEGTPEAAQWVKTWEGYFSG